MNDKTAEKTAEKPAEKPAGSEKAAPGGGTMKLAELKAKSPADLLAFAESLEIENASTLRKQEMMFAILKSLALKDVIIDGEGTVEVLPDGFGFLRSPEANYLAGPDDIYVSPNQVKRFGLRTGDTVQGQIRAPKDGERYFALLKVDKVNFGDPEAVRHRINFDNLTPLYPERKFKMEIDDPTYKDKTGRVIDIITPQGMGQRALIVAPPRTGKTVMLQNIAHSIAPRPGRRDGDREGQAPRRAQARRRDPARFDHAPRARLQHGGAVFRQGADRRRRRERAAAAEALLRRRAQHRAGRLALDHRDRPHRHRQPHGRGDLRRVQGHR
jgi:hypothetical protein